MKTKFDELQPGHVAAGLGNANREFLAVCLGVFDDSKLLARVEQALRKTVGKTPIRRWIDEAESSKKKWQDDERLTDDHLRTLLWIKLQRALAVRPRITQSIRGCQRLVDDLVTAGLQTVEEKAASPGFLSRTAQSVKGRKAKPKEGSEPEQHAMEGAAFHNATTNPLVRLVEPLLSELIQRAMGEDDGAMDEADKDRLVSKVVAGLSEEERQKILSDAGSEDIDRAVRDLLAFGAAHSTVAVGVAGVGFPAYIFAAQASAFIPFVSGPMLVSLVSVLANPVFVVATVAGLGWYWNEKGNEKAAAQVAVHVIALLACAGLKQGRPAVNNLVMSFPRIPEIPVDAFTDREEEQVYKSLWQELDANSWLSPSEVPLALADHLERQDMNRDSVAIGAVSMGDFLYSLAAIDPHVVAAADFARGAEINNAFDFAVHFRGKYDRDDRWQLSAQDGDIAALKGFTMEQLAAAKLSAEGHMVELAEDANQPGWDLIVDGQKFQVKCLANSSLNSSLKEHFDRYPDIPVLANSDLASNEQNWPEEWRDKVFFLEGHTNDLIEGVVKNSFEKALDPNNVPEIAFAYVATKQLWSLKKGEVTGTQASSQILLEGGTRAGLAVVGSVVGPAIGLVLFGPAGALIGGSFLPIAAQAGTPKVVRGVKKILGFKSKKEKELDKTCMALCDAVELAIDDKLATLRRKYRQVGNGAAGAYMRHRFKDEARHLDECQGHLFHLRQKDVGSPHRALEILRTSLRAVHPARYQEELRKLFDTLPRQTPRR